MDKLESCKLLVGVKSGKHGVEKSGKLKIATLENSLAVIQKGKYRVTINKAILLISINKRTKNTCTKTYPRMFQQYYSQQPKSRDNLSVH